MLTAIQKSLDTTTCPSCNKGKLIAVLRCDLDPDQCIAKANCNNCSSIFHLNEMKNDNSSDASKTAVCEVNGMVCTLIQSQE